MKVIELVKRNISLLNSVSIVLLLCILYELITISSEDTYHGSGSAILLGLLVVCLVTLLIDYILRLIFKDKIILFLIELVFLFLIPFIIMKAYF